MSPASAGQKDRMVRLSPSSSDTQGFQPSISLARAGSASHGIEREETRGELADIIEQWARRSRDGTAEGQLRYWERKAPYGRTSPHLMYAAEEGVRPGLLAWPTPNSMREVEPSTAFTLKKIRKN